MEEPLDWCEKHPDEEQPCRCEILRREQEDEAIREMIADWAIDEGKFYR